MRRLAGVVRLVRLSSVYETAPVGAPAGSPPFLNLAVLALAEQPPNELLAALQGIESDLGRRPAARNEPRVIDLDLILYEGRILRGRELTLPHPRFRERNFVLEPLRELRVAWTDPVTGKSVGSLRGEGEVRRIGPLY
jgi:2-amino-4-hydroxy-6-hydroxymethyldihydropteridine diphosphokinase